MNETEDSKAFILRISELMVEQGLNDTALSTKADLSPDYMHRIRKRKSMPKIATIKKLAIALEVPVEALTDTLTPANPQSNEDTASLNRPLLAQLLSRLLVELGQERDVAEALSQSLAQVYQAAVRHQLSKGDGDHLDLLIETEAQKMLDELK